jgi:signal transduction histidine kinase
MNAESAQVTNNILEDILLWARTQKGSILFNPQKFNLTDIIKNVLEVFKPGAYAKGITISCANEEQINVSADKDILRTIILHCEPFRSYFKFSFRSHYTRIKHS